MVSLVIVVATLLGTAAGLVALWFALPPPLKTRILAPANFVVRIVRGDSAAMLPARVLTSEAAVQGEILRCAKEIHATEATILAVSLVARVTLITSLVKRGVAIKVIVQDPAVALDPIDKDSLRTSIDILQGSGWIDSMIEKLTIYKTRNIATRRAVLLSSATSTVLFLGAYHYSVRQKEQEPVNWMIKGAQLCTLRIERTAETAPLFDEVREWIEDCLRNSAPEPIQRSSGPSKPRPL
jgi:hypothetical protein